jgi:hypothetical protein
LPIPALAPVTSAVFPFIWRSMRIPVGKDSDEGLLASAGGPAILLLELRRPPPHCGRDTFSGDPFTELCSEFRLGHVKRADNVEPGIGSCRQKLGCSGSSGCGLTLSPRIGTQAHICRAATAEAAVTVSTIASRSPFRSRGAHELGPLGQAAGDRK